MKIHSLAIGVAALTALTTMSFSQINSESTTMRVKALGAADKDAVAQFNVYLPLTHQDALEQLLEQQTDPASSDYHHWLTPAQFKERFGPSRSDFDKATAVLQASGLSVVSEKTQSLEVQGPVWAIESMFSTRMQQVQTPQGHLKFAATKERLNLPQELASLGAIIPEFTTHLAAHVHSKKMGPGLSAAYPNFRLSSSDHFYYPNDLNEAYSFPSFRTKVMLPHSRRSAQVAGVGAHIGIIISSVIDPNDLEKTFNSSFDLGGGMSLIQSYSINSNLPVPTVNIRRVGRGSGPFNPASSAGIEASLDTQMSLGTAPGAEETLYNMEDLSDSSILAAYTAVNEDNAVDIVSSSFGECELDFTKAYNSGTDFTGILKTFHSLFQQGNAQGITFVASSGDSGALACLSAIFVSQPTNGTSFVPGVESPADDPNVTAVGGTNLSTIATPGVDDAKYEIENADFDPLLPALFQIGPNTVVSVDDNTYGSGGGYSMVFSKPAYQSKVNTGSAQHRAVPDVSLMAGGCPGNADISKQDCTLLPRSTAIIWIGGQPNLVVGTSASAPQLAGVLALAVQINGGRLGNVNPLIYSLSAKQTLAGGIKAPKAQQYFHRSVSGNNNFYTVKPGQAYSLVLGNSTLDVKNFLGLQLAAPAGTPNTPSNP